MTIPYTLIQGASLPDLAITWKDRDGNVINFTSGFDWTVKLGPDGGAATVTKTNGVTGAASAPNVIVQFTATDLAGITAGRYVIEVTADRTSDHEKRKCKVPLRIEDALDDAV